ncbi:MAG: ABC transporter substrate-binding protein [Planctomycetes bacterium]|nr:ABC transporter substrate-binding protein [Planctomycetota bacterium]
MPTLLLAMIFCGCTKKSEPVNTSQDKHTTMRIISMAPNLTEILFALGLDDEIVGVTKDSTFPEKAKTKTCVGTFWQPDIEAVLMCRPTLVLTLGFEQQTTLAHRLEKIGCETLSLNIESIADLYEALSVIGSKVNKPEQARKLVLDIQTKEKELVAQYASSDRIKVLWVVQRQPLRVAGTKTFANELIEIAGGVNAIGDTINIYPPIGNEEFIGSMPDVIIEPSMDTEQAQTQKATAKEFYRRFSVVPAVANDRICIIDGDLASRLGPRLAEAMQQVSGCLRPEGEK